MIKNRKHGHLGIATNDIEADAKWYVEVLGFEVIGDFHTPDGIHAMFMKLKKPLHITGTCLQKPFMNLDKKKLMLSKKELNGQM